MNAERIRTIILDKHDQFEVQVELEPKTAYQLALNYQGALIRSDYFSYESQNRLQINIVIPPISKQIKYIKTPRIVYVISLDKNRLRISHINNLVNSDERLIDTRDQNYIYPFPQESYDHRLITQHQIQDNFVSFVDNQAKVQQVFMPGEHQFIFEYFIDTFWSTKKIDFPLPKRVDEIEILTLADQIQIQPLNLLNLQPLQYRQIDNRRYQSLTIDFSQNQLKQENLLQMSLSGIPLSSQFYFMLAACIFVVLLIGLAIFIKKTKNSTVQAD